MGAGKIFSRKGDSVFFQVMEKIFQWGNCVGISFYWLEIKRKKFFH